MSSIGLSEGSSVANTSLNASAERVSPGLYECRIESGDRERLDFESRTTRVEHRYGEIIARREADAVPDGLQIEREDAHALVFGSKPGPLKGFRIGCVFHHNSREHPQLPIEGEKLKRFFRVHEHKSLAQNLARRVLEDDFSRRSLVVAEGLEPVPHNRDTLRGLEFVEPDEKLRSRPKSVARFVLFVCGSHNYRFYTHSRLFARYKKEQAAEVHVHDCSRRKRRMFMWRIPFLPRSSSSMLTTYFG